MTHQTTSLFCVLLLAACGGSTTTNNDSGTGGNDAAIVEDAAHGDHDAGPDVDAFVADVDAFVADVDAFVPPPDCEPHTFVVTASPGAYQFDGGANNAPITLCAGITYTFDLSDVDASHPIRLLSDGTSLIEIAGGATDEYTVPVEGPQPDSYDCRIHHFGGDVTIVTP